MRRLALPAHVDVSASARGQGVAAAFLSGRHDSLRDGTTLGLIVATSTWARLAVIDVVPGQSFRAQLRDADQETR